MLHGNGLYAENYERRSGDKLHKVSNCLVMEITAAENDAQKYVTEFRFLVLLFSCFLFLSKGIHPVWTSVISAVQCVRIAASVPAVRRKCVAELRGTLLCGLRSNKGPKAVLGAF
jgi:hypothetical protein